jgi:HD-GYP domain-containing protein (c-di-GMP phosphodiesterase class II)
MRATALVIADEAHRSQYDTLARAHEHWDGGGYPDGLAETSIPLGARIILACDALSAMTTDRPYRRRRPLSEALRELQRCSGSQFDPAVIDALVAELA